MLRAVKNPLFRLKGLFKRKKGEQNGIKDIILKTGSKNFLRLKIGIGKSDSVDTKDYVLGKFNNQDRELLDVVFLRLRDVFVDYISMNRDSFIQKYNTKIQEE